MQSRIVIEAVHSEIRANKTCVEVLLNINEVQKKGRAEGADHEQDRLTSMATLDAVHQAFHELEFNVDGVRKINIDSHQIVVVLLSGKLKHEQYDMAWKMAGCALVRGALPQAVANATMDALNRVLEKYAEKADSNRDGIGKILNALSIVNKILKKQ